MIKWFSNLFSRGSQVKNENKNLANTAQRVGSLFEDLAKATPMKWDADASYEQGQVAYWNDIRIEAVDNTLPGESPDTHPLKWSKKIILDKSQITANNRLPTSGAAVYDAILAATNGSNSVPNATKTVKGIVRQSTDAEVNDGIIDDAYISPLQLKGQIGGFTKPTFKQVLTNGDNVGEHSITLQDTPGEQVNYVLKRGVTPAAKALVVQKQDGSEVGRLGFDQLDNLVLSLGGLPVLMSNLDETKFATGLVTATQAQVVSQTLATTVLQSSASFDYIYVPYLNPLTNRYELKAVAVSVFTQAIINRLDAQALAARIAPYLTNRSVPNDRRVIESPIYCFVDKAVDNEEYITITPSMYGTPQPHHLQASGDNIRYTLIISNDNDTYVTRSDMTAFASVRFPSYTTFQIDIFDSSFDPSQVVAGTKVELYLRKKTFEATVEGDVTRYVIQLPRIDAELPLNDNLGQPAGKVLYLLPVNATPPGVGDLIEPIGSGLERYYGYMQPLGTDCVDTPPPVDNDGPVWKDFTPKLIPYWGGTGSQPQYSWSIELADALTIPAGKQVESFAVTAASSWLNFSFVYRIGFDGIVPANLTSPVLIELTVTLTDGKSAKKVITFPIENFSVLPYLLFQQYDSGSNRSIVFRGGGEFGSNNAPYLTVTGPAGFTGNSLGRQLMNRFVTGNLNGRPYFFDLPLFINPPAGTYTFVYESISGIRYGTFTLSETNLAPTDLVLTTTPPDPNTVPIAPVQVQYAWDPTSGTVNVYVLTNGGTGKLEAAFDAKGPQGYQFSKTGYTEMQVSNFGSGYTHNTVKTNIAFSSSGGLDLTVYIRRQGDTTDLAVSLYIPGNQIVPRSLIHPAPVIEIAGVYASYALDGSTTATITKVGYTFQRSSNGTFSTSEVYFTSDGTIEVGFSSTDNPTPGGFGGANAGTYSNGYNRYTSIYGVYSGQTLTLHFRQQGTTTIIRSITLPVFPNTSVALTQVYP